MVKKNSVISAILLVCIIVSPLFFASCSRKAGEQPGDKQDHPEPENKVSAEKQPGTDKPSEDQQEKDTSADLPDLDSSKDQSETDNPDDLLKPDNDEPYAVRFADKAFEEAIREHIGKATEDILITDIEEISEIDIYGNTGMTGETDGDTYRIDGSEYQSAGHTQSLRDLELFPQLERLEINYLPVGDISVLKELNKLIILGFRNSNISDISVLAGLTDLEQLDLEGNQIRDISPLKGLTKLEYLCLSGNPISETQIAELKRALPDTEIIY